MNYDILLLPTAIFITSVLVYYILKEEIGNYLKRLKKRMELGYRVMNLQFLKEMISFFSDSKTSNIIAEMLEKLPAQIDENAEAVTQNAMSEIEYLHRYLNAIRNNSQEYFAVEALYSTLIDTVVLYGISIAVVQYMLLFSIFRGRVTIYLGIVNVIVIYGTIIFGCIVGLILMQIYRKTRRINTLPLMDFVNPNPRDH